MHIFLPVLILVPLVLAGGVSEVKQAFDDANIPTDLALAFDPTVLLQVIIPQPAGPPISLAVGEQVPRDETAFTPSFALVGSSDMSAGPFVVAAVDPDAPTPQAPTSAQVRHFLGGNYFAGALTSDVALLVNGTAPISAWRQPTPPAGSDAHRYIFLVFNQPADFNAQTLVNATTPPTGFNISAFGAAVGLGEPIAGNFMLVAPQAA